MEKNKDREWESREDFGMWCGCPRIQLKFRSKWGEAEGRTQGTLDTVHLAYRQSGVVIRKESWTRSGEEEDECSQGAC